MYDRHPEQTVTRLTSETSSLMQTSLQNIIPADNAGLPVVSRQSWLEGDDSDFRHVRSRTGKLRDSSAPEEALAILLLLGE